jgi:ectoine hydroxylase-related dioxygenase (phytanoyl-CoA dioxygenase family)
VKEFVMSRRLGKIASDLLEVDGVRLYHDQALYKETGGGITPWHADQYYWPLATSRTVTAWIPLQQTTSEMGPLAFAAKSQTKDLGRGLPIDDESERKIQQAVETAGYSIIEEAFDLGELSYHLGWTFHRAGENKTNTPRAVMTMIYMDRDMTLAEPTNDNQVNDWNGWCPGVQVGAIVDSPKNPVIYSV